MQKKKATPAKKVVKKAPVVEVMSEDSEDSDEVVVQTLTRVRPHVFLAWNWTDWNGVVEEDRQEARL
jgi:hypothetical protein